MTSVLHIDASARPGGSDQSRFGSHTRRLTARFMKRWLAARSSDELTYRDVGQQPPTPVSAKWIHAAFTPPERREAWMVAVLAESDVLVDELFQFIQLLGLGIYESYPKRSIDVPLHAGLFNQDGRIVSRDNQFDGDLPSWFDHERTFDLGTAQRQIPGLSFHLV